jgi:hypothetical protein
MAQGVDGGKVFVRKDMLIEPYAWIDGESLCPPGETQRVSPKV